MTDPIIDVVDQIKTLGEEPNNLGDETMRIGEDGICPRTKLHCDDECCPVGATCNFSDEIQDCES